MNWNDWIGKTVFIKTEDNEVFTFSTVLAFEKPYLSITDKFGLPVVLNVKTIVKIKEEKRDDHRIS